MKIAIINGPNLNLTGKRTPQIYGHKTMEEMMVEIQRQWIGTHFVYFQSNHEGALIDYIQKVALADDYDGIIINAGGYAHTSVALRDALDFAKEQNITVVNIHLSNIRAREDFRQRDLLEDVCTHTIIGHGIDGYKEAVEFITRVAR